MVLAAGLGSRMRPLTLLRAKPVLPVLNRPLLHWTLERLARHGVTDVVVNLHHLPETVRAAVGDGSAFGLRVRYSFEEQILGRGGGPAPRPRLLRERALPARERGRGLRLRHLTPRGSPRGGESPRNPRSPAESRSTHLRARSHGSQRPHPFRGRPTTPGPRNRLAVHGGASPGPCPPGSTPRRSLRHVLDLYGPLVEEGEHLQGLRVRGAWYDLGAPPLYLAAQLRLLARQGGGSLVHPLAHVDRRARVTGSVVGARARVEAGAVVERSVIWEDAVIGPGGRVRGSIVISGAAVGAMERVVGVMVFAPGALPPEQGEERGGAVWVKMS